MADPDADAVVAVKAPLPKVTIYTDGSCLGNPGPGGWGFVAMWAGGATVERHGSDPRTTNNRMELIAACEALESLEGKHAVHLHTDSEYVVNGITRWIDGWRRRDWRTQGGKKVMNDDLWMRLLAVSGRHEVRWTWVRGHAGNAHNERADELARTAAMNGARR